MATIVGSYQDCVSCLEDGSIYVRGTGGDFQCVKYLTQLRQEMTMAIYSDSNNCNLISSLESFSDYVGFWLCLFLGLTFIALIGKIVKINVDRCIHEEYMSFVSLYTRLGCPDICIVQFCEEGMMKFHHKIFGPYIKMRLQVERKLANKVWIKGPPPTCLAHGSPAKGTVQKV